LNETILFHNSAFTGLLTKKQEGCKTMKKILAIVLALAMILSLAACGSKAEETKPAESVKTTEAAKTETVKEEKEPVTLELPICGAKRTF